MNGLSAIVRQLPPYRNEWRTYVDREPAFSAHFRAQSLHAQLDPDLRSVEQVIEMFRAFFNGTMPPADLDWRKFEI
jgi:hypothetical protein